MKNPFKWFRSADKSAEPEAVEEVMPEPEETEDTEPGIPEPAELEDSFEEWCRSQIRGGIERRERNDIFEAYSVFGADGGELVCRYYHRYPEHERDFDLSNTRKLSFDAFNKRLLSELDKGDIKLSAYNGCIIKARELVGAEKPQGSVYEGFTDEETAELKDFCEAMDTLTDKEYRSSDGVFFCGCGSVVGEDRLNLRFRKPLEYDALYDDVAGVSRKRVEGYDIDDLWTMGVYNRLRERCERCEALLLTSEWNLNKESVYLMKAEGFRGIDGTLLLAVSDEDAFRRFGFFSLDFANK